MQLENLESRTLLSFTFGGITIPDIPGIPSLSNFPALTNQLNLGSLTTYLNSPTERWWLKNESHPGADINAENAWNITTGSSNVVIAVLDTGYDLENPDLASVLWTNPGEIEGDSIDNDSNGKVDDIHGWNFLDDSNEVQDNFVHGTAVAGVIHSVAPGVTILPVQIGTAAGVDSSDVIAGINYIIALKKAGVNIAAINASYISFTPPTMDEVNAIKKAGENGMLYIAASGNAGLNLDSLIPNVPSFLQKYIPSYLPFNLIFVAATDDEDGLAGFSDYGKNTVAVGAPGVDITLAIPGGLYAPLSGTSFAAPMVSGIVGLLKSKFTAATLGQMKDAILKSGDLAPALAGKTITGHRVDAFNALNYMMGNQPPKGAVEVLNNAEISGWAFDPNLGAAPVTIRIMMDNTLVYEGAADSTRGDLSEQLGSSDHGFSFDASSLPYGKHAMKVFAIDSITGKQTQIGAGTLIVNEAPEGALLTTGTKLVTGWALDSDTAAKSIQVKLFLDGKSWLTTTAKEPQADAPDAATSHGFTFKLPAMKAGVHRIDAYAVDSLTGALTLIGSDTVSSNQQATGEVETLNATTLSGWAFDADVGSKAIQIKLQIDDFAPVFITANGNRPDLQASLGSRGHGFTIALPQLTAGGHNVHVWAVDANNKMLTELIGNTITVTDPDDNALPAAAFTSFSATLISGTVSDSHALTPAGNPPRIRIDIDGKAGTPFLATAAEVEGTYSFSYIPSSKLTGVHRIDVWAFDDITNAPVLVARQFINYVAPAVTVESFTAASAAGFGIAPNGPGRQAQLRLDIDGLAGSLITANLSRPDQLAGLGILKGGFSIPIYQAAPGDHVARLYAVDPVTLEAVLLDTVHFTTA
jgi:hypothetical protein